MCFKCSLEKLKIDSFKLSEYIYQIKDHLSDNEFKDLLETTKNIFDNSNYLSANEVEYCENCLQNRNNNNIEESEEDSEEEEESGEEDSEEEEENSPRIVMPVWCKCDHLRPSCIIYDKNSQFKVYKTYGCCTEEELRSCRYLDNMIKIFPNITPLIAYIKNDDTLGAPFKFSFHEKLDFVDVYKFNNITKRIVVDNIRFLISIFKKAKDNELIDNLETLMLFTILDYVMRNGNILITNYKLRKILINYVREFLSVEKGDKLNTFNRYYNHFNNNNKQLKNLLIEWKNEIKIIDKRYPEEEVVNLSLLF